MFSSKFFHFIFFSALEQIINQKSFSTVDMSLKWMFVLELELYDFSRFDLFMFQTLWRVRGLPPTGPCFGAFCWWELTGFIFFNLMLYVCRYILIHRGTATRKLKMNGYNGLLNIKSGSIKKDKHSWWNIGVVSSCIWYTFGLFIYILSIGLINWLLNSNSYIWEKCVTED